MNNTDETSLKEKIYLGISSVFSVVALLEFILWILIFKRHDSFKDAKTAYFNLFPEFLRHAGLATGITILLLLISIALFSYVYRNKKLGSISLGFIIITSLLLLCNIWSIL
ncbi:hypothetical protein [Mesonia maritima]|uniref:Cbb3-type cytochrome oxidase subunit 3 n=1 Tax=Mesonia maritima TaxID=1793873 RepID=A0ABU1K375_9FLAO|nr:hypothetical protein [Mesonia maritima]MDR6299710.1 cbb3-type cytochrome oxidase subunit 3 [Mesonia maritima]